MFFLILSVYQLIQQHRQTAGKIFQKLKIKTSFVLERKKVFYFSKRKSTLLNYLFDSKTQNFKKIREFTSGAT